MRYEKFKDSIRSDVEEFIAQRRMTSALELSRQTGHHFNHSQWPLFFTGDLDSPVVLVHLNPKQTDNYAPAFEGDLIWNNFDDYFDFHENFGRYVYGKESSRKHKSQFDHKQIRFLKEFDVLPFSDGKGSEDKYYNLEIVTTKKLQLELIPYGSDNFESSAFKSEILQPHLDRILDVICSSERQYVLFCGQVFRQLLKDYIVDTEEFRLTTKAGKPSVAKCVFSKLEFSYNGKKVKAGLASSYARQGLAIDKYGRKCRELY